MAPLDTDQTIHQNPAAAYDTDPLDKAVPEQSDAVWQHLKHILAAQHLDELSDLSPDQISDIKDVCCSLLRTSTNSSAGSSTEAATWNSEQQQQLELLLNAASHALSLYIEADTPQQAAPAYPVLTSLLNLVADILEALFQGSKNADAVLLQQYDASAAVLQSPGAVRAVLQPALPLSFCESPFDVQEAPGG